MANWVGYVINQVQPKNSLGSDLESFILSKNPKTAGDVEYWTQYYFLYRS